MTRKKQTKQKKTDDRMNEPFYRDLVIEHGSIVEESRTVELSFSSEVPYRRFDFWENEHYDEILSHADGAVDMGRLESLGTVLFNHDRDRPIGGVERVWIEDGRGKALVRFDEDSESESIYQKVLKGSLKGVSVGYKIDEWDIKKATDGAVAVWTAVKWEPLEISIVSVPADASVGVGRSIATEIDEGGIEEMNDEKTLVVEETPKIDVEAARADAVKADRARVSEIRALEKTFDMDLGKHIDEGTAVEEVRKLVLEEMAKAQEESRVESHASVGTEMADKFRDAARDAILLRAGVSVDKPAAGADELGGFTLRELMFESLRARNLPTRGGFNEAYRVAMSTSDFPHVLGAVANKSVLDGWNNEPETWSQWVATGTVSNFHVHEAARLGEADDLDVVRENDEYNYGETAEQFEQYQVLTYGKLFAVSRQAIINDDLSQLTEVPAKMGAAASRKVSDVVYAAITLNPDMGDGKSLFHADHGNYIASGGSGNGAPSLSTIGAAILAMKTQKDVNDKARLNIMPKFLLAPVALEMATEQFFLTSLIGGAANQNNLANPYAGRFTRIYEPRLDDALSTGWYMAADKGKTVKAFFLDGNRTPYLERQPGWNVDGVEFKVRIDVGAKAMDYRGLYFNYGA